VAAKFVLEKDAASRFRFRLMSQGRILASSESYTTKRAAQNAIASIRTTAPGAQIDDTTQAAAGEVRAVKSRSVAKKLESVVAVPRRRGRSTAKSLVAPATRPVKRSGRATKAAKTPAKRATKAAKRTTKAAKK
jgi:uncharacterized protein